MAGDWIKMRSNLRMDPDVIQIADMVQQDEFTVVGRLHAVWAWLDQHSTDGTNVRITSAFLDRLTACPGFADAMRTVGWLAGRDGAIDFPGYEEHNGDTAKQRAVESKRKRVYREKKERQQDKCPKASGTNVPEDAGLEKRREDDINSLSLGASATTAGGRKEAEAAESEPGEPKTDRRVSARIETNPQVTPPTLPEVLTVAKNRSVPTDCAEKFWNSMMANGWVDRGGQKIRDWTFALRNYATAWRANEHERGKRRGGRAESTLAREQERTGIKSTAGQTMRLF